MDIKCYLYGSLLDIDIIVDYLPVVSDFSFLLYCVCLLNLDISNHCTPGQSEFFFFHFLTWSQVVSGEIFFKIVCRGVMLIVCDTKNLNF